MASEGKLLKIIIAVLLPPLAVFMHSGLNGQFWLNVVLTVLGFWVVGIVHALVVIM